MNKQSIPSKLYTWFSFAIRSLAPVELYMIVLSFGALVLIGYRPQYIYLWWIIALCDIVALFAHGAWIYYDGDRVHAPWHHGIIAPMLIRTTFFALLLQGTYASQNTLIAICIWYVAVASSVCYAFYCILKTMHEADHSWLAGTAGHIGIPNWISIIRIALSVLIPHIYAVQSLGANSNLIASIILALAISTDAVDGFLARKLNQTTKAGKALDPLGDKIIFYPTALAAIIATHGTMYLAESTTHLALFLSICCMTVRDIIFIIWFFMFYAELKNGIGASLVDKIRMVFMCIWLAIGALMLTFPSLRSTLNLAGFISMIIIAILSIVSIFVDFKRVKPLLKHNS